MNLSCFAIDENYDRMLDLSLPEVPVRLRTGEKGSG